MREGLHFYNQLNIWKFPKGLDSDICKLKSLSLISVTELSYSLVNYGPETKNSSKYKNIHQLLCICQNCSPPLPHTESSAKFLSMPKVL